MRTKIYYNCYKSENLPGCGVLMGTVAGFVITKINTIF